MCQSICSIKRDICSLGTINTQLGNTTTVEIYVDQYGNLEIIDPDNQLGAVYSENAGNFSSTGTKADNFQIDQYANFKFTP